MAATVRATRAASLSELVTQSRARLDRMLAHGTTTAEVKTGYGLELATELKQLDAIRQLDATHPIDLVPTFLGAHAVPAEYRGSVDEYVDLVVETMLPAVRDSHLATRLSPMAYRLSQDVPASDELSAISDQLTNLKCVYISHLCQF